ncbi:MAG: hypothetical protein AB8G11_00465 [Saprospiraceae bacterium]
MQKISVQTEDNVKSYLNEISKMKISELEFFAQELHSLIVRKRSKSKKYRIGKLYELINETVLETDKQVIFNTLAEKLANQTMTEAEHKVYLNIAEEEENIRTKRVAYMVELSQLRQVPFTELMSEIGLKQLPHV